MIYEVSPSISQEYISTWGKEDEDVTLKFFSKLRSIRSYIAMFVTYKYQRRNKL